MVGVTPRQKLRRRLASGPVIIARAAAGFAIREALAVLKKEGNPRALRGRMLGLQEYSHALKLDDVEQWEKRYLR